ncbi:RNA 2',3'-cyclic phosphodiesterase [Guyparkeria halopsychrophila]|uniref:RNA 2',3'-cyclic phosphodiesterase n=1 Tax=Guyparkeria halopsychrophila TaxID=3139421 RepID=UPI0037C58F4B
MNDSLANGGEDREDPVRRVFLALWPDDATRAALHHVARSLPRGRGVPTAHLHLTLAFPGNVGIDVADCLAERLNFLAFSPIPLVLDRLGHFAGPRVTWIGPRRAPEALEQLAAEARGLCLACGVRADARPFVPHVTLRRFARPSTCLDLDEPMHWFADTLVLVESGNDGHPGPYRLLARWPEK